MAGNLNARIVDVSKGDAPTSGVQVIQYVPNGWSETLGWAGPLLDLLDKNPAQHRILLMHEPWRGPLLNPRTFLGAVHDQWALRSLASRVGHIVVTTGNRARMVTQRLAQWPVHPAVHVMFVPSNVHLHDPLAASPIPDDGPLRVAIFARAGGGVLARALADALKQLHALRPDVELVILGERGSPGSDSLSRALLDAGVLNHARVTGHQPAEVIAQELARCHVGIALHDTGISGRRGTVSAMLACGLPVVTASGVETDEPWRNTLGISLCTDADAPSAAAIATRVVHLLDEKRDAAQARRDAAWEFYMRHCSWRALGLLLTEATNGQWMAPRHARNASPASAQV